MVQTLPGADQTGNDVPQHRRLVTASPRPGLAGAPRPQGGRGRPRASAPTLPVFVERPAAASSSTSTATQLIDFGSGIAVTCGRERRTRGWSRRCGEQVGGFTHTCFMVTPYEGYVAVCEALAG